MVVVAVAAAVAVAVAETDLFIPDYLLFQWHITDLCNQNCTHCYGDHNRSEGLELDQLLIILEQYKDFLLNQGKKIRGQINITGGEPFLKEDFFKLLEEFSKNAHLFRFAILSNGILIDNEIAKDLKKLNVNFVQISLDGDEKHHDNIRGKNSFQKTINGLKNLQKAEVKSMVSFTALKSNYKSFSDVYEICKKLKVDILWTDRYIPANKEDFKEILSPEETKEYIDIIHKEKLKSDKAIFNKTQVRMSRALQFIKSNKRPYRCTAGRTLLCAMPNGDLYPCRRMPVYLDNLLNKPLKDIYHSHEMLINLRKNIIPQGCQQCFYSDFCLGGLKCLSYALTSSPFNSDPGCWKAMTSVCNTK